MSEVQFSRYIDNYLALTEQGLTSPRLQAVGTVIARLLFQGETSKVQVPANMRAKPLEIALVGTLSAETDSEYHVLTWNRYNETLLTTVHPESQTYYDREGDLHIPEVHLVVAAAQNNRFSRLGLVRLDTVFQETPVHAFLSQEAAVLRQT